MQSKHNDDSPGLVLPEKASRPASDDNDRKMLPVFLRVDSRPVSGIALRIDSAAAHGIARRIPDVSVNDDDPGIHGVSHGILGVAEHLDLRAVQIRAKGIAGNAVNFDFPAAHSRADKAVAQAAMDLDTICANIREKLILGIDKRLDADAPLGFLLSGGLDSSLVCAISARVLGKHVRTFAIGMDTDAIDLKYARMVADYIGAEHTEVYMTRQQVLDSLDEVIALLGIWTS